MSDKLPRRRGVFRVGLQYNGARGANNDLPSQAVTDQVWDHWEVEAGDAHQAIASAVQLAIAQYEGSTSADWRAVEVEPLGDLGVAP